jgi:hypothetical protein
LGGVAARVALRWDAAAFLLGAFVRDAFFICPPFE